MVDFKGTHPKFASYFLRNALRNYQNDKAAVPGVDRKVLHALRVRVPDFPTQEAIALILSTYDELIENNRRRMALLEEAARQLYREWFVRLHFPGHEHTRITDDVPQGWTRGCVADFFDTGSGGTPSRKNPEFFTDDIPWVKTQELQNAFIIDTDEKITGDALKRSAAKLFPRRSVLVAMYGVTIGQVGILSSEASCNQACCAILARDERASYIYAFLFFVENKQQLVARGMGAAQNNVSQQIIRSLPILLPPRRLMDAFTETLEPLFEQQLNLQRQVQKLRTACDLLLPRLMSGEIAV